MNPVELFSLRKRGITYWFYVGKNNVCYSCKKRLELNGYHVVNWDKKNYWVRIFCTECLRKKMHSTNADMQEIKPILFATEVPAGSIPCTPQYPGKNSSRNVDVFQAATKQLAEEEIIDHTKLAGRSEGSIEGATIGKALDYDPATVLLSDDGVDKILEFHKYADPAIEEDRKELIE